MIKINVYELLRLLSFTLITDQHYHATAASHYTHSLSVTFLCPPPPTAAAHGFL